MPTLKRLEKITDLRSVWPNEASDFTPWLAQEENITLLGDTIGIELEVEAQEERVGTFKADILCKDTVNNHWVLIENQLERTDHCHMGQLLTYAAGLDAVTIIWIAQRFTEEHRAALDWLNEKTDEAVNFFGLEVELWKIGNSDMAPKFNIVSKPNDWTRSVKSTAAKSELSETKKLQQEYWVAFRDFVEDAGSFLKCQKPQPQHWTNFSIGRSNFVLCARMNTLGKEIGAHLVINGKNKGDYYKLLEDKYKVKIEQQIDIQLNWRELPDAKESQIVAEPLKADPKDQSDWARQHEWLKETIEKLHRVLAPIIKQLDLSDIK